MLTVDEEWDEMVEAFFLRRMSPPCLLGARGFLASEDLTLRTSLDSS